MRERCAPKRMNACISCRPSFTAQFWSPETCFSSKTSPNAVNTAVKHVSKLIFAFTQPVVICYRYSANLDIFRELNQVFKKMDSYAGSLAQQSVLCSFEG